MNVRNPLFLYFIRIIEAKCPPEDLAGHSSHCRRRKVLCGDSRPRLSAEACPEVVEGRSSALPPPQYSAQEEF